MAQLQSTDSSAVATGGSVAAGAGGSVEGGIHGDRAAKTPLLPTPPAPPAHFTGREADLNGLARLLTSGENVAITGPQGMGGIGKTALAQKLAERVKDAFPGGVLWWSLGPQPDVYTALDVWARHADPRTALSALAEPAWRANVVRAMLARLGPLRVCAIIDDVWQVDAARMLMSAIPPRCPILITTRDGNLAKPLHCRVERISALSADESVALLAKLLGPFEPGGPGSHARQMAGVEAAPAADEAAAREIAKLTRGLPLALELVARLADSSADLPALAGKLREKPRLDILKMPGGETREESVEACLALSYDHLAPDMQRRFRALGVFAPAPLDRAAIAAAWGEDDGEAVEQAIRHLIRRNLLSPISPAQPDVPLNQEYRQHTLLRAYALALLERAGEHHDAAVRHADYYRQLARQKDWHAVETAFEQIDWGLRWVQANAADRCIDYVLAVQPFLDARGRKVELLKWLNIGLTQAHLAGDRKQEGTFVNNIGGMYDVLGRKPEALERYQQALAIHREVGDPSGQGTVLNHIGRVYDGLGQKQQALETYQQALAIFREIRDRGGEGTTLNNLGGVYDDLGQKQPALEAYQQALALFREVGDRAGEGATLNNISMVYSALGRKPDALERYQQALALFREVGDRAGAGTTLNNIGRVYDDLGLKQQALEAYQQALAIHREVGDRWAESVTLFNIGTLLDGMGHTEEAIAYLEQNVALDEAIGHPDLESDRAKLEELRRKVGGEQRMDSR